MRDTTRALILVEVIKRTLTQDGGAPVKQMTEDFNELTDILTKMDARTGRRDPSVRKRAKKP